MEKEIVGRFVPKKVTLDNPECNNRLLGDLRKLRGIPILEGGQFYKLKVCCLD